MAHNHTSGSSPTLVSSFSDSSDEEQIPTTNDLGTQFSASDQSSLNLSTDLETASVYESAIGSPVQVADERGTYNQDPQPIMSRSFTVPSKLQITSTARDMQNSPPETIITRHDQSSVKHLTCFWWKEKGICRFSDQDCLYAHYDTGNYTDPPRQLIPGEPALAGRKLDRAIRNLSAAQRTSPSPLYSIPGSRHGSRPGTPGLDYTSPIASPVQLYHAQADLGRLTSENQFLRNLVTQNAREKATMISHIEDLKADNQGMKTEMEGLRTAQQQLLAERESHQNRIHQLQTQVAYDRNTLHGAIGTYGRARMNSETRYLGGLLED